ncbi:MAG: DinB family protein [Fimbriimonas sp.]
MSEDSWTRLRQQLQDQLSTIESWEPCDPDPAALRCEFSRHRTLAHLRAGQEQWLVVLVAFLERDNPSVKILHPWRQFAAEHYDGLPWEVHMSKFVADRRTWLARLDGADPERPGKWNGKPDTVGNLTSRLADHEAHHIKVLCGVGVYSGARRSLRKA